jgi:SWI/SNF-related matrix-associated actin-dependent regulator 1 of chromatin subfamily A
MLLDYVPETRAFTLRVGRSECDVQELIRTHGLDFSLPRSTSQEALLFTREPYAAAAFGQCATPRAIGELAGILDAVEKSWAWTSGITVACPSERELWPFQRADVEYALQRRNTLVGDQPGLGKTPVAICFANEIKAKRVLVICPANIRLQWAKRIREWTTLRWPYTVYPILRGGHGVHPTAQWTIVSYDLARTEAIGKALARLRYDLLILDEGHYLKTIDSERTRAVFGGGDKRFFDPLAGCADRILALTGTPLPNRPREAYTLARGLCFDAIDYMSEEKFRERFNPSFRGEVVDAQSGRTKIYIDERSGRHAELQNRLRANFMVRHLKRDVMPQLQLPEFDIVDMEETGAVKQALHAESLLHIDPDNLEGVDYIEGHIAAVRRMMGIAVAPQVAGYCKTLLEGGEEKLVVFAWHIEVLNILQRALEDYGCLRVDGSTSATRKQNIVDLFIHNPDFRVIIGNMLSLGTGTDGLQEVCTHGVVAEPDWVFGNNQQCVDRLDRGGQKGKVLIDFCCAPSSIVAQILNRALEKGHTVHAALDKRIA